jgi:iron complex transport system substrate-binding protein
MEMVSDTLLTITTIKIVTLLTVKLFVLALLCFFCAAQAQTTYPITLNHASGQTRLEKRPLRVVAVGSLTLDVLLALGHEPVGYAASAPLIDGVLGTPVWVPFFGQRIKNKPVYLGDFRQPSLEALLALKPDLIIAPKFTPAHYQNYSRIAPTLEFDFFATPWKGFLPVVAKALGREERAFEVIRAFDRQTLISRSKLAPLFAKGKKVSVIFQNTQSTFLVSPFNALASFMQYIGLQTVLPEGFKSGARGVDAVQLELLPSLRSNWCVIFTPSQTQAAPLLPLLRGAGRIVVVVSDPDRPSVGPSAELATLEELTALMLKAPRV